MIHWYQTRRRRRADLRGHPDGTRTVPHLQRPRPGAVPSSRPDILRPIRCWKNVARATNQSLAWLPRTPRYQVGEEARRGPERRVRPGGPRRPARWPSLSTDSRSCLSCERAQGRHHPRPCSTNRPRSINRSWSKTMEDHIRRADGTPRVSLPNRRARDEFG